MGHLNGDFVLRAPSLAAFRLWAAEMRVQIEGWVPETGTARLPGVRKRGDDRGNSGESNNSTRFLPETSAITASYLREKGGQ